MFFIENARSFLKRRSEITQSQKTWNYDNFKNYLILLSLTPEFVIPKNQSPKKIRLNESWHELLNQMWKESRDGDERYAIFGREKGSRNLYLPEEIVKGRKNVIPGDIIWAEKEKVNHNKIIVAVDIHSHVFENPPNKRGFSSADLYNLISPIRFIGAMCVAEMNENFLALRTKETRITELSQEQFIRQWEEKHLCVLDTSLAIAQEHNLAIYSGKPNEELVRITT